MLTLERHAVSHAIPGGRHLAGCLTVLVRVSLSSGEHEVLVLQIGIVLAIVQVNGAVAYTSVMVAIAITVILHREWTHTSLRSHPIIIITRIYLQQCLRLFLDLLLQLPHLFGHLNDLFILIKHVRDMFVLQHLHLRLLLLLLLLNINDPLLLHVQLLLHLVLVAVHSGVPLLQHVAQFTLILLNLLRVFCVLQQFLAELLDGLRELVVLMLQLLDFVLLVAELSLHGLWLLLLVFLYHISQVYLDWSGCILDLIQLLFQLEDLLVRNFLLAPQQLDLVAPVLTHLLHLILKEFHLLLHVFPTTVQYLLVGVLLEHHLVVARLYKAHQ